LAPRLGCSGYAFLRHPIGTTIASVLLQLLQLRPVHFIFVGHSGEDGALMLNGNSLSPDTLFSSLWDRSGYVTFHLFTCWSFHWEYAYRSLRAYQGTTPTVSFGTIPTQDVSDEMNDRILAYHLNIQGRVTTQISYGNSHLGHFDLDQAAT
jgi:hypothetical protein